MFGSASAPKYTPKKGKLIVELLPSNDILDFIKFLYYLPSDFICTISSSQKGQFSFRMDIYAHGMLTFSLFFTKEGNSYQLILEKDGYELPWIPCSCNPLQESPLNLYQYKLIIPEVAEFGTISHPAIHPYIQMGKKLFKQNEYRNSPILSLFADPHIAKSLKKHQKLLQTHFQEYINNNFTGSIIIYSTLHRSDNLVELSTGVNLFGLTWIFPWAISVLLESPSCLMTDTTFKVLKPYTMAILHIIRFNESIAIGLSISPSETASSYQRILNHLVQIMNLFHIDKDVIQKLPLVADQGTALVSFAKTNHIDIKFCHRHMIEAAGASSRVGNWVARLLQAQNPEEFDIISTTIKLEIHIHYFPEPNQKEAIGYYKMTAAKEDIFHLSESTLD
jgi:hypothetical protein